MKVVGLPLLAGGLSLVRHGTKGFQVYVPGGDPDKGWASDSMPDTVWAAGCVLAGSIMCLAGGGICLFRKH